MTGKLTTQASRRTMFIIAGGLGCLGGLRLVAAVGVGSRKAPVLASTGDDSEPQTLGVKLDPIYGAIERHKASNAAFALVLHQEVPNASPEYDEWHRRELDAIDAERDACNEMITTAPTTRPGLLALLHYVGAEHARGAIFLDQDALFELLSTTAAALDGPGG